MIPNPWVILAIGLAWIASLVGVGMWQREDGATAERVIWQAKAVVEATQAAATIKRLQDDARKQEQQHAADLAEIGAQHAKEKQNLEARRHRDVADARDGALKLRVAGICPVHADRSTAPEAGAAASGGDDATAGELPGPIAAALLDIVDEADIVATQLTACQAVILSDRKGASP